MIYKNDIKNNSWIKANKVFLPDGRVISSDNRIEEDGFFFCSDKEPLDYTLWLHSEGFNDAIIQRREVTEVIDIDSLLISKTVLEDRENKTFSVPVFLDGSYYFIDKISYTFSLTDTKIRNGVIDFLNNMIYDSTQ